MNPESANSHYRPFETTVVIEGIKFVFKDGRVVDYDAKTNKNALDELFESENADYLGEVALVPQNSPIAEMRTLFYNTLFDENASCHLALGDSYPSSIKNGTKMSKEELENAGLNSSYEHVDFMIGTDDLTVTGIDEKGNETPIIIDGKFCI